MVFNSLFQKMSQNLPVYLQRYPPCLPKMKQPVWCPIWNPPSLPKMKLPIGCPIWNPLKHEHYRFLSIHVYSNLPKNGRQCTPPPQGMKKLDTGQSDIFFLADVPPPGVKKLDTGQSDILLLADVPPPQEWKSWIQVKVTFWFWLMYPPPPGMKKLDTGQSDILVLADVPPQEWKSWIQVKVTFWFWLMYPPPEIEIGLNMNAIGKKSFQERSPSTFYQSTPPPSITIIWFCAWTENWWISISNGYMDSNPIHHPSPAKKIKCSFLDYVQLLMISRAGWWTRTPSTTPLQPKKLNACFWITFNFWWLAGLVDGLEPHLPPLSSQKNQILIFGLRSTSDDRLGWSMDLNPICHPSPAKKIKCSFLNYIQLLMIGRAGRWTQNPSATPLQPKK